LGYESLQLSNHTHTENRGTTLPRTKYNISIVTQRFAHKQGDYKTKYSFFKLRLNSEPDIHPWSSSYNIPIVTTITRGFHICSHQ